MNELGRILELVEGGDYDRAVLVTLVRTEGSSYRRAGAKMLMTDAGAVAGSISGGCIEAEVKRQARSAMEAQGPRRSIIDTTGTEDAIFGSASGCPGRLHLLFEPFHRDARPEHLTAMADAFRDRKGAVLTIGTEEFVEVITPPSRILVFGGGDDAIPLVRIAHEAEFEVIVIDPRASVLKPSRFPGAIRFVAARPDELPADLAPDEYTVAVVTTHNYDLDRAYAEWLLATPVRYVAVVSSRARGARLKRELGDSDRIFGPAGLDLGSESPAEIALAVVAQARAVLTGRSGGHLVRRTRRVGAVLLAAGRSRRLGRSKQLVEVDGEPLVLRTARAVLDAGFDPVCVVVGAEAEGVRAALDGVPVSIVTNDRWRSGVGSSIAAGVRELSATSPPIDGILIALSDQARIESRHFDALRDAFCGGTAPMVAASYAGTAGAPAIFGREKFEALLRLRADEGARRLLRDSSDPTLLVPIPEAEFDLDTPEDEQNLRIVT